MERAVDYGWEDNPVDVSAEVNFIWQVATLLHGVSYRDADHRDVILPMTILRRLEGALEPIGTAWGGDKLEKREADVKAENRKGGRYPAGLPGTGDSQLLFVQSAVDKMDETKGRAAVTKLYTDFAALIEGDGR